MKWLALSWLAAGTVVVVICLLYARICDRKQRIADTYLEARIVNRAQAEEARLAALPELPVSEPSWVIMGWNREEEHLVLASQTVKVAAFQQRRWVEETSMSLTFSEDENPAMQVSSGTRRGVRSRPLNLVRRSCDLSLTFPVYTLLHVRETSFNAAIAEVRKVWQPS